MTCLGENSRASSRHVEISPDENILDKPLLAEIMPVATVLAETVPAATVLAEIVPAATVLAEVTSVATVLAEIVPAATVLAGIVPVATVLAGIVHIAPRAIAANDTAVEEVDIGIITVVTGMPFHFGYTPLHTHPIILMTPHMWTGAWGGIGLTIQGLTYISGLTAVITGASALILKS